MADRLPDPTSDNISLHTIPFAVLVALFPRLWARYIYKSTLNKDIDAAHPRDFTKALSSDTELDTQSRGRLVRAEAAMQNGFDNLGFFAAAVVAGNSAGLNPKLLN